MTDESGLRERPCSVGLAPEVNALLIELSDVYQVPRRVLLGRLITWFLQLDRTSQAIALGHVSIDGPSALVAILQRQRRLALVTECGTSLAPN